MSGHLINFTPVQGSTDLLIWENFKAACTAYIEKQAVCMGEQSWTYKELLHHADDVRQWLMSEVGKSPILFVPKNQFSSLAFIFGSIASGKVPLFADPAWTFSEIKEVIRRCAIQAVIREEDLPEDVTYLKLRAELGIYRLHEVIIPEGEMHPINLKKDTAFGRFTSGTTGFSRCLQFSNQAALAAAASWREAAGLSTDDRILCLATLNNGLAFNTSLLSILLCGGLLAFHRGKLVPSTLNRTFMTVKPTVLVAFPFVYELLANRKENLQALSELRLAVSSAALLPTAVRDRWKESKGLFICDYYGLAEVGPCTFNDGSEPDSVGVPLSGVSFAITTEDGNQLPEGEVGRIRVKTQSIALDYLDTNEPFFSTNIDNQGFYITRDRGFLTPEGKLVLRGRVGNTINIAGRKIDPAEVEATLRKLSGVQDVVVWGEQSANRVLLSAYIESSTLTRDEVVEFCALCLAQYKVPQAITILPKFPRSSTGKISIGRLQELTK